MILPPGLRAAWIAWRNARLRDPHFQRFAADFPLTRATAHRRTAALFDLLAGFSYTQTLRALVATRALERLAAQPLRARDLAATADLTADAALRLLRASAALGLTEMLDEDRFALGAEGAALLGQPGLLQMIAHHDAAYADLADPVALLKSGRGAHLSAFWSYAGAPDAACAAPDSVAAYSTLMAATQPAVAADVLDAYRFGRHRVVMDVGGGEGAFLDALATRHQKLTVRLFDLPAVVARAKTRLAAHGPRATFFEGDFLRDPLPDGADLITFIRVLHDHDEAGVRRLLAHARQALKRGGRVLIAEPMAGPRRPDRVGDAYFAWYLLAMGRGVCRTPRALQAMLREAGFRRTFLLRSRTPSLLRILAAEA